MLIASSWSNIEAWAYNALPVFEIVFLVSMVALFTLVVRSLPRTRPQEIKPDSASAVGWEDIAGVGHEGAGKLDCHFLVRAVGALRRHLSPEPEVGGSHPRLAQEGQPTLGVRRVSQEVQTDVVFVAE